MNLKIATFNISGGVDNTIIENDYLDQKAKTAIDDKFLNEIIKMINDEQIEVMAFQEIITTKDIKYIDSIVSNTDLKFSCYYELSPCNVVENTNCGLAVLSKYPIIEETKLKFTNPNLSKTTQSGNTYFSFDKGGLRTKININGKYINYITLHSFPFRRFNAIPEEHENIFIEFDNFVSNYDNIIVLGDFNAENAIKFLPKMKENVAVVFDEPTTIDGKKFDNILISKKFNILDQKLIRSFSDHCACISTIQI